MRYLLVVCFTLFAFYPVVTSAQNRSSTDNIVSAARQAAQQQRYAEAAALLRKAIEQDPSRRASLLREYADDLKYSGHPSDAIPLYNEVLASGRLSAADAESTRLSLANALADVNRRLDAEGEFRRLLAEDGDNVDARLDYAQFLWDGGDLGGARAQYCTVLVQEPRNEDAQQNLARLESWRGRYREAKRLAAAYLRQHKGDRQSSLTLAQDELWMGRADEAAAQVNALLQTDPFNGDARSLLAQVRDSTAPRLRTYFETAKQSDNLLIQTAGFAADMTPDGGRTTIAPYFERYRYSATDIDAEITVEHPGIQLRRRFTDWSELTAEISSDRISAGEDPSIDRSIGTYVIALSAWPNDALRINIESRRETFDNLLSLAKGISARFDGFSVQYTPDERTRGDLRYVRGTYSDGNRENRVEFGFGREILRRPSLTIGLRGTEADFSRQLANGYFNPGSYHGVEATAELSGALGPRFDYDLGSGLGAESTNPGGSDTAYSANGSLSYRLGSDSVLQFYYDSYNSYQSSHNGFARHAAGIELRQKL